MYQSFEREQKEQIEIEGLKYAISNNNKTAEVSNYLRGSENVIIPRTIFYKSNEYIVTSILDNAFMYSRRVNSIQFPSDSVLHTIGKFAFSNSKIESISIPSSVNEIKTGWCHNTHKLTKVIIMPDNPYFQIYENVFILKKSSQKTSNFDVLSFAVRNIKIAKIPDFIEVIEPYAFENCESLRNVEFSPNSKLRIIGEDAFCNSSIEKFTIPSNICKFEEGWCKWTMKLNKIELMPNKNFLFIDNSIIIGKSNQETSNFDVLIFAVRNIKKAKIPNCIQKVGSYCFEGCKCLQKVDIPSDSEMEIIEKNAFSLSTIDHISFPDHLTEIDENAFFSCHNLRQIDITSNSELRIIGKSAFTATKIDSFYFPPHITQIENNIFSFCKQMQAIEFAENDDLPIIDGRIFEEFVNAVIMIPVNLSDRLGLK